MPNTRMYTALEHERAYRLHKEKVGGVRSRVDNSPPRQYPHLNLRLKQLELQEQRNATIDRENKLLLRKMQEIMEARETTSNQKGKKEREIKSLNNEQREREHNKIMSENIGIARRIERTRPMYRVDKWEADYKHKQYLMDNWKKKNEKNRIYAPPLMKAQKEERSPRNQKSPKGQRKHRDDDEEEDKYESDFDTESDDEKDRQRRKGDKLPPINSAQSQKHGKGNETNRSKGDGQDTQRSKGAGRQSPRQSSPRPWEHQERKWEYKSPDPDLWMYYGFRPKDSDDEEEDRSPRKDKTKGGKKDDRTQGKDVNNTTAEKDGGKESAEKQAENDARQLYKVAKENAPAHEILIKTLAKKSFKQRMKTKDKYREMYEQDLESDLKKGLGNEWSLLIESLLNDQNEGQSEGVAKAMKSGDPVALVKKVAPLSNQELSDLKEEYLKENSISLESDISKKYKNPVQLFLLTLVKGNKSEKEEVSEKTAEKDAKALYEFGDGRWTSNKGKFILLLEEKSPSYMRSVFEQYKNVNKGKAAAKAVQEECPKDYAQVVTAYISCTESAGSETADNLHKNLDPTNPVFVKTVVAKSDSDIPKVRKEYKKKFGKDLAEDLEQKSDHTTIPVLKVLINKNPKGKGGKDKDDTRRGESEGQGKSEDDAEEEKFDPDADAEKLHNAVKGLGTDEDAIINIIPCRTNAQRQEIKKRYKELYKQDLIKDLKGDLSGDFEDAILGLMMEPVEYDAHCLREAMKGLGTDETTLVGIICSKSKGEMSQIKDVYKKAYKKDLESDIKGDTSGEFRDLLLHLVGGKKKGDDDVDEDKAEKDAKDLYENSSKETLREIFTKNSKAQIDATAKAHQKLYNKDISESIKKASSGDSEEAYLAVVKSQDDKVTFYTERLNSSVKGLGTNEKQLTRIIVSTSEGDLPAIQSKYKEMYGKSLKDEVQDETSGDYRKTLLKLIGSHGGDEKKDNKAGKDAKQKKGGGRANSPKKEDSKTTKREGTKTSNKGDTKETKREDTKSVKKEQPLAQKKAAAKSQTQQDQGKTKREDSQAKEDKSAKKGEKNEATAKKGEKSEVAAKKDEKKGTDKGKKDKKGDEKESKKDKEEETKDKAEKEKNQDEEKDEDEDATRLYKAMKGLGTDEDTIIDIIPSRSNAERQQIKKRYQELYKKDLEKELKSELSGDLEEVILGLMMPPVEYDAFCLYEAMKGKGTDEAALIGILCSKTPAEIDEIKGVYKKAYKTDLDKDVKSDTSGDFRDLLVQKVSGQGDEDSKVDQERAEKDAKALHDNPSKDTAKQAFSMASLTQVKATAAAHEELFGEDITESIKKASSGDAEDAYIALVKSQDSLTEFYAQRLNSSMKGFGTNDSQLIRILVSRSELDLPVIKGEYQQLYSNSLRKDVESDTSGDYRKVLLKIIDNCGETKPKSKPKSTKKKQTTKKKEEPKQAEQKETKRAVIAPVKAEGKDDAKGKDKDKDAKTDKDEKKDKKGGKSEQKEDEKQDDDEDATRLYKAMKGLGTDEDTIIDIIPSRSNAERQQIKKRYQELYKKELEKDLKSELSGDLEEVILGLMMPPVEYDAFCLHEAMKGLGTDETTLIGIITAKSTADLKEIKAVYKKVYKQDLEKDVSKDTSGEFRELLVQLLNGQREEGSDVNKDQAEEEARTLRDKPSKEKVREILAKRSPAQVKATGEAHQKLFGESITESIRKACSGDAEMAYLALVKSAEDEVTFYAERLNSSMEGKGTNETQLSRILVAQSEMNLPTIMSKYEKLYSRKLRGDIDKETSGDYKKALLAILDSSGANTSKDKKKSDESKTTKENKDKDNKKDEEDAIKIFQAMDGLGTNEDVIIGIITRRSNSERQDLKSKYQDLYKKDLTSELKSELSGDLEETILGLMMKPVEYDAHCLHESVKGMGTDETILIGILCSHTPPQLADIKKSYKKAYRSEVSEDIRKDTSGDFQQLLLQLLNNQGDSNVQADKKKAETDAKKLHDEPSAQSLKEALSNGNKKQISAVAEAHKKLFKEDITESIKKASSGDTENAYLALVKASDDEPTFYAERLNQAMKGVGTNDTLLIRTVVSRSEVDLPAIKSKYQQLYKRSLRQDIESDTSGDYKNTLLKIVDKK
ncbi:titin homolog [Aplysia californica]|uniref:Annexin n=1 Tax=Aplysia californica TaxID=6500 RepID=A0ABM1A027_APLCA|nr:titin homolog [Aplysia californica]